MTRLKDLVHVWLCNFLGPWLNSRGCHVLREPNNNEDWISCGPGEMRALSAFKKSTAHFLPTRTCHTLHLLLPIFSLLSLSDSLGLSVPPSPGLSDSAFPSQQPSSLLLPPTPPISLLLASGPATKHSGSKEKRLLP